MLNPYTNIFQEHNHTDYLTYSSLVSCLSKSYVDRMIAAFGKKVLRHLYTPTQPGFALNYDLYLQNCKLYKDSRKYQKQIDKYLQDILFLLFRNSHPTSHNSYSIKFYSGLIKFPDSTIEGNNGGIDKRTGKSIRDELDDVDKLIHKFARRNDIKLLASDEELPAKISQSHHIYLHAHIHFLPATVVYGNDDRKIILLQNYVNKLVKKFHLVNATIHPLIWKDYARNIQIPVELTDKPKLIQISTFKLGNRIIKPFNHKPQVVMNNGISYFKLTSNQLSLLTVNTFINYLETDYRIQTKDTDPAILNISSKMLTQKQRHLVYMSWMEILKGKSSIHKVSTQTMRSTHRKMLLYQSMKAFKSMTLMTLQVRLTYYKLGKLTKCSQIKINAIKAQMRYICKVNHAIRKHALYVNFECNKTNHKIIKQTINKVEANNKPELSASAYSVANLFNQTDKLVNTNNIMTSPIFLLQLFRYKPT